jgi:hypothetical protein
VTLLIELLVASVTSGATWKAILCDTLSAAWGGGSLETTTTVSLLLNDGRIDINLADNDGNMALSLACEYNYQEIVDLLVKDTRTELGDFGNVRNSILFLYCMLVESALFITIS